MYYLGWALFIVILVLWRKDVKNVKETHRYIIDMLKNERKELDTLKDKYANLLPKN